MALLDPALAIVRALATTRWHAAGRCLEAVDSYYGNPGSRMGDLGPLPGGAPNGNWQDAIQGWYGSAHQHPGNAEDAPAGVPIYWRQMRGGSPAGHIALSLGGGLCRTTGGLGVYTQSIRSLNAERPAADGNGGSVMGWTEDYGNNPIAGVSEAAALPITPIEVLPERFDTMAAPDLFHLVFTDGNQAYVSQGIATQQAVSGDFMAALEKGYDKQRVVVNEADWFAITQTWKNDLQALTAALGKPATASPVVDGGDADEIMAALAALPGNTADEIAARIKS